MIFLLAPLLSVVGVGLSLSPRTGLAEMLLEPVAGVVAVPEPAPVAIETAAIEPVAEPAAPAPTAVPEEAAVPADAGPPALEPGPCAAALDWVAGAGLPLPDGIGFHCPSTEYAHQGAACWVTVCSSAYIAINMDRLVGASPEYLRHVVAHEICHILDWQTTGRTSEAGADACAAAHGA